jgi:hypothetical protein
MTPSIAMKAARILLPTNCAAQKVSEIGQNSECIKFSFRPRLYFS